MNIAFHFFASLIIFIVLFPIFGYNSFIMVMMGGVIIDIDHYFWYVYKYRRFGLKEAYRFYQPCLERGILHIFHTAEFIALCVISSFFSTAMLLFTISLIVHSILDFIFIYYNCEYNPRVISLILYLREHVPKSCLITKYSRRKNALN